MKTKPNKKTKREFSKWLEQLQQESWQLELLISGLAIFGIWENIKLIYALSMFMKTEEIGTQD